MPSLSFVLGSSTTLLSVLSFAAAPAFAVPASPYRLDIEYSGSNFFDGFDFFDQADPTHGFVTYLNRKDAGDAHLINTDNGQAYMGVDSINPYDSTQNYYNVNGVGRPSVRISSQRSWKYGLFVADIEHAPSGLCGTWPAFWTLGTGTWPETGEIDIFEGANDQSQDWSTLHTGDTCSIPSNNRGFTGSVATTDCNYNDGDNGTGCKIVAPNSNSYGNFNSNQGGTYAMEWTTQAISVWFFPRGSAPDMTNPDPSTWPNPIAKFPSTNCNLDSNFDEQRILFDNTFCGDLGEATWGYATSNSGATGCAAKYGRQFNSCAAFVGGNPGYFADAYWSINYVRVFQKGQPTTSTTSTTSTTTTSRTTTSATTTTTTTSSGLTTTTTTSHGLTTATTTPASTTTTTYSSFSGYRNTSSTTTTSYYAGPGTATTSPVTTNHGSHPTSTITGTGSAIWEEWPASTTTTKKGSWDPKTTSGTWADWDPKTTTSTTWADWDPKKTTTTAVTWEDWDTTTTKKGSWDPKTTSGTWADWDPKKTTTTTAWEDWSASTTKKVVAPTGGAETWADWTSTVTATGVVTRTVQPLASTPVQAAGTSAGWGAGPTSTGVWAAKYTGAAEKNTMSNVAMFAAAGVAGVLVAAL